MPKSKVLKNATPITEMRNGTTYPTKPQIQQPQLQQLIPTKDHKVFTTPEGEIVYVPHKDAQPEVLHTADDICGIAEVWGTSPTDALRPACAWHDKAYINKDFFNERGWSRKDLDDYFLHLMLNIAGDNKFLKLKAKVYYYFSRMFGGKYYNRR